MSKVLSGRNAWKTRPKWATPNICSEYVSYFAHLKSMRPPPSKSHPNGDLLGAMQKEEAATILRSMYKSAQVVSPAGCPVKGTDSLGVDSSSVLFNHPSFQKADPFSMGFRRFRKIRIPGFRMFSLGKPEVF